MDPIHVQLCRAHILANILEHSAAERHVGIVNVFFSGNVRRQIPFIHSCSESPVAPAQWLCL